MTAERARAFAGERPFVELLAALLRRAATRAQLRLEVVMLVAAVCLFADAAKPLLAAGVVAAVVALFRDRRDDLDTQAQCLFAFHRFVCHARTRAELLGATDALGRVVDCAASTNAVVNRMANAVIEAVAAFDPRAAASLKGPRFDAFNREWIEAVAE
jgi:hypothetical protein